MKLLAEYVERATDFERMAGEENNAKMKAGLLAMAIAYRKLAAERVKRLKLSESSP
jgi:hypothetical protein